MGIMEQLDRIRADEPACLVAAYADLSTGMVLGASTRTPLPREDLDVLLNEAMALLPEATDRAVLLSPDDTRIFLRDGRSRFEAWCCIFPASVTPSASIAALEKRVRGKGGES